MALICTPASSDVVSEPVWSTSGGHFGAVISVDFSPDGLRIVTGSADGTARIWDAFSGEEIHALIGHSDGIESVAFSPDGTRVLTGSLDETAKLWNALTGAEIRTLSGHSQSVLDVAFFPDGTRVLTGSSDNSAKIWEVATGAVLDTFTHQDDVRSVAVSPDGSRILTGCRDDSARIWSLGSGFLVTTFTGHTAPINSVAFSPDGGHALSGGDDFVARLWDAATGESVRDFQSGFQDVDSVAFSPDGTVVLTCARFFAPRLWDAATGMEIGMLDGHEGSVLSAVYSSNGARIVTGSDDFTARIWNATTRIEQLTLPNAVQRGPVSSVAVSPDGAYALTASWDGTAVLRDIDTGEEIRTFAGHTDFVNSAAFSSDGMRIVTGSDDGAAIVWDTNTGDQLHVLSFFGDVKSAAFSTDGTFIATGLSQGAFLQNVVLWDAESGDMLAAYAGDSDSVQSVAFSPDGDRILAGYDDNTAILWDRFNAVRVRTFVGHANPVNAVAFSPDGAQILTGSTDSTAKLWDTATGNETRTFTGHLAPLNAAVFSPDGAQVLTGAFDVTARLWDAATGVELRTFTGHLHAVAGVAFTPDGRHVLTGSWDNKARLFRSLKSPTIEIDPVSHDFGFVKVGRPAQFDFTVSNLGDLPLNGAAMTGAPFSIVSGSPYSVPGLESATVTVQFTPVGIQPYADTVVFSGGGDASAPVTGEGMEPLISVSPASREVSAGDGMTSFNVSNSGTGVLNWAATEIESWLTIESGASGSNAGIIEVRFDPNPTLDQRVGTITISSADADNSPRLVTVTQPVGVRPTAAFSADTTVGLIPLTVQFSDTSEPGTSEISTWTWDFGDGEMSAEQNPVHTYDLAGMYTVRLTVATAVGSDTVTRSNFVNAGALIPAPVVTTNQGNSFATFLSSLTLEGTTSAETETVEVNGAPISGYSAGDTTWSATVNLDQLGRHVIEVTAVGALGIESSPAPITINRIPLAKEAYVSPNGDNAGAGTETDPWMTIQFAMDAFRAAGPENGPFTVNALPGTYDELVTFAENVALTGGNGSQKGGTAVILPSAPQPDAVVVAGAEDASIAFITIRVPQDAPNDITLLRINNVSMTVDGVIFDGDNRADIGIDIIGANSSGSVVRNCTIRNVDNGIEANNSGATITRNRFESIRFDAIFVDFPENLKQDALTPVLGDEEEIETTGFNSFGSVGQNFVRYSSNVPVETLAQFNDWGVFSEEEIRAGVFPVTADVEFDRFLGVKIDVPPVLAVEIAERQNSQLIDVCANPTARASNLSTARDASSGLFIFFNLEPGVYDVLADADGYDSSTLVASLPAGQIVGVTAFLDDNNEPSECGEIADPTPGTGCGAGAVSAVELGPLSASNALLGLTALTVMASGRRQRRRESSSQQN